MFSRRDVQRSLDELAQVLSPKQLADAVQKLNSPSLDQISAEWEVMVLSAIARISALQHEVSCGGTSRPDVHAVGIGSSVQFVADVCAVSDADIEDDNPIEYFKNEMHRVAREIGLAGSGLFLDVAPAQVTGAKQRRLLALPPKGEIPRFVRSHIQPFLEEVAAAPQTDRKLEHTDGLVSFTLRYQARQRRFSGGSHLVYTNPRTTRNNPLHTALVDKAGQLRRSGFAGSKGVLVCDAGCSTLATSAEAVIERFFGQHRNTVSFIAVLDIPEGRDTVWERAERRVRMRLFWSPHHESAPSRRGIEDALNRAVATMPPAINESQHARHRRLVPNLKHHGSFEGGVRIDTENSREKIRISARAVLHALAGDTLIRPGWGHTLPVHIFQAQIREGRTIRAAHLERSQHQDDDWLVLELDGPDAAVVPYRVPDPNKRTEDG